MPPVCCKELPTWGGTQASEESQCFYRSSRNVLHVVTSWLALDEGNERVDPLSPLRFILELQKSLIQCVQRKQSQGAGAGKRWSVGAGGKLEGKAVH